MAQTIPLELFSYSSITTHKDLRKELYKVLHYDPLKRQNVLLEALSPLSRQETFLIIGGGQSGKTSFVRSLAYEVTATVEKLRREQDVPPPLHIDHVMCREEARKSYPSRTVQNSDTTSMQSTRMDARGIEARNRIYRAVRETMRPEHIGLCILDDLDALIIDPETERIEHYGRTIIGAIRQTLDQNRDYLNFLVLCTSAPHPDLVRERAMRRIVNPASIVHLVRQEEPCEGEAN